jgi:hypothetical protein
MRVYQADNPNVILFSLVGGAVQIALLASAVLLARKYMASSHGFVPLGQPQVPDEGEDEDQ